MGSRACLSLHGTRSSGPRPARPAVSSSTSASSEPPRVKPTSSWLATDPISKRVSARLYRKASKLAVQAFLKVLIRTVPSKIHTILTDNNVQFSGLLRTGEQVMMHPFTRLCWADGIEHRRTEPRHPLRSLLAAILAGTGSMARWPLKDERAGRANHARYQGRCPCTPSTTPRSGSCDPTSSTAGSLELSRTKHPSAAPH